MLPKSSYRLVGYKLQVINLDFRLKNLKIGLMRLLLFVNHSI